MSDQDTNTRLGHSTGPRTGDGKENSSHNAATHGLSCKKFFLLHDETEEEFLAHSRNWFDEYKEYSTPALDSLIQDLVEAHWLQKRAARRISESECALANAEANRDSSADEIFRRLRNIQRYKTSYENSFQRAFRAVETFCKNRNAADIAHNRAEQIETSTAGITMKFAHTLVKTCRLTREEAWKAVKVFFKDSPSESPESAVNPAVESYNETNSYKSKHSNAGDPCQARKLEF